MVLNSLLLKTTSRVQAQAGEAAGAGRDHGTGWVHIS